MTDIRTLFKNLLAVDSPAGSERARGEAVARLMGNRADETFFDPLGNLVLRRRRAGRRIMVCARLDSAGLMAKHVDARGGVHVMPLGKLEARHLAGARVRFDNGVTGVFPSDFTGANGLVADVGSGESAARVRVGATAVFPATIVEQDGLLTGPCGSAATCVAALLAARGLWDGESAGDVSFVFAAQGEVGQRGVKAAVEALSPELGFAVDLSEAAGIDGPAGRPRTGNGPVVVVRDGSAICRRDVVDLIESAAAEAGISLQREVPDGGESETALGHFTEKGVPAGVIAIPVRYRLTPNEICSLRDVEQAAVLLEGILREYTLI